MHSPLEWILEAPICALPLWMTGARCWSRLIHSANLGQGRESVVVRLTEAVRFLSRKYSSSHTFKGVGVGLPGIIDLEAGTLRFGRQPAGLERLCSARRPGRKTGHHSSPGK